jgi:pimeloyl-ACP methyl ester carboxylesterase
MDLHVDQRGEGEPLVLVMGMSGNSQHWGEPFLDLLARDFQVTTFDNRGVGQSPRIDPQAEPFTIADMARDTVAVLDRLGLGTVHLLGISMGGMIAQEVVLRHPDRVRTLVLGCSYAGGEGSARTAPATLQRMSEAWQSADRERALRTNFEINVSREHAARPGAYEAWRKMALSVPIPVTLIIRQLQAAGGHDAYERLDRIEVPTLLVHGTADGMLPAGNSRAMAERIPGARLVELDGVGHLFWWEQPARSAELVRDHVRAAARAG